MRSLRRSWLYPALTACLLASLLTAVVVAPVRAAGNANAKIMLHALSQTTKNPCTRAANIPATCAAYSAGTNNVILYPTTVFVYALVVNGSQAEGIGAASFGINYDPTLESGVDVYSWTSCGNNELPSAGWPAPGGGNTISFTTPANCQTAGNAIVGAVAALGYFYCSGYTPDVMRATPHPDGGVATVSNCAGQVDLVIDDNDGCTFLGAVGFGPGSNGINPCGRQACSPPITCTVDGPTEVTSGQTGIEFTSFLPIGVLDWTITGNGTFDGPTHNETVVRVTAGAPGQFTVKATYTGTHLFATCSRTVTVQDPVATTPASWGRIKSLVRGQ